MTGASKRERASHIFDRQEHDHYVEPEMVSYRLFEEEDFPQPIWDPACGWGRIVASARLFGLSADGTDIRDGPATFCKAPLDFLEVRKVGNSARAIVTNPPFALLRPFIEHALSFAEIEKAAFIAEVRKLPAAGKWLERLPLQTIWLMTPRPSMPTGEFICAVERGERDPKTGKSLKVGGGTKDFVWLVFARDHVGPPQTKWLKGPPGWKVPHAQDVTRDGTEDRRHALVSN